MTYFDSFHKLCCFLLILGLFTNQADGQNVVNERTEITYKRNTVTGNLASFLLAGEYSLNYERSIVKTRGLQAFLNAGFGGWYISAFFLDWRMGYSAPVSLNTLIGRGHHLFEVDLGARYIFYNEKYGNDNPTVPVIKLGYRYQKRGGTGLILRGFIGLTGIGFGVGKPF